MKYNIMIKIGYVEDSRLAILFFSLDDKDTLTSTQVVNKLLDILYKIFNDPDRIHEFIHAMLSLTIDQLGGSQFFDEIEQLEKEGLNIWNNELETGRLIIVDSFDRLFDRDEDEYSISLESHNIQVSIHESPKQETF